MDLVALLASLSQRFPDRPLYTFLGTNNQIASTFSVQEIFGRASSLAVYLRKGGIGREPIGLFYPHSVDFIIAFFAVILAGGQPVPMCKARGRDWGSVESIIRASRCRHVLTTNQRSSQLKKSLCLNLGVQAWPTDDIYGAIADLSSAWSPPEIRSSDVAFIQFTSGSTSAPKGVVITHDNIIANSDRIKREFGNAPGDIGVGWLPFFHDMGLIGHIIQPLYAGMHSYFISPVAFVAEPFRWLNAISTYQCAVSGGPDVAYKLCCDRITEEQIEQLDLSTWRLSYSGAEKIRRETMDRFARRFSPYGYDPEGFFSCYGLAESTLFVSGRKGTPKAEMLQGNTYVSIGPKSDRTRIVDPEAGTVLGDDAVGELWVRSLSVAAGYYRDDAATDQTFNQSIEAERGWLKTGDLVFSRGSDLYFVGRLKNVVKKLGKNIHLEDVESAAYTAVDSMHAKTTAAAAIEIKGQEEVVLLVELYRESSLDHSLMRKQISQAVYSNLGITLHAVLFCGVNAIPLTTSGKIQRAKCPDVFLNLVANNPRDCLELIAQ